MKTALIIFAILVVLYLIFSVVASFYTVKHIVSPKYQTRKERQKRNEKEGILVDTECFAREETLFKMSDDYIIHGDISLNNPKKFIVFAHGHGSTREGTMKYTKLFYEMGYSLVLYDERGHGDNERVPSTMGINESKDLSEIVGIIKDRFGKDIEVGVFGYSMGGATACLATQYLQNDVKFMVIDCAYSSLKEECINQCFIHNIILYPAIWFMGWIFKAKYGFGYGDCDVKKTISTNKIPMCFFHGTKDKTVFPRNSEILFKATASNIKRLYIVKDAGHSKCIELDPESYKAKVKEFIESVGD